ncbi:hypothetical protein HPB48_002342 [Haemaphysalis longicornis]|uniref:Uncharacterized protein n=1 Tax=Haemaphysalis longicornis TaxID=44386 RepID=A0A9J6GTL1_HAELO|nr:hypothetical protein HPB48_002342 [Haemaphysalis longicornis]
MGHVRLIKLRTQEATQRLITAGGIQVKGRFCTVIDPAHQELTIRVHWVPFHLPDEAAHRTFTDFGGVKHVRQDACASAGFESAKSTTRRGHIRKGGRVPKFTQCHSFGQEARDCVRTYADVTGRPEEQEVRPDVMNVD